MVITTRNILPWAGQLSVVWGAAGLVLYARFRACEVCGEPHREIAWAVFLVASTAGLLMSRVAREGWRRLLLVVLLTAAALQFSALFGQTVHNEHVELDEDAIRDLRF